MQTIATLANESILLEPVLEHSMKIMGDYLGLSPLGVLHIQNQKIQPNHGNTTLGSEDSKNYYHVIDMVLASKRPQLVPASMLRNSSKNVSDMTKSVVALPLIVNDDIRLIVVFYSDRAITCDDTACEVLLAMIQPLVPLWQRDQHHYHLQELRLHNLEVSKSQTRYITEMSRAIRTPLTGVSGMLELLLHSELEPKQQKYLSLAYQSSRDLVNLVNDIIDYSHIETGQLSFEFADFNLQSFISDFYKTYTVVATKKDLRFLLDTNTGSLTHVASAPHRLRQVLTNLVGNALKFTKPGKQFTLRTTLQTQTLYQAHVKFEIIDEGIGIAEDKLPFLFQKFSQLDQSITKEYGGTGLGLAISKEIVHKAGGNIGVTSSLGEGSCFWFTWPFDVKGTSTGLNLLQRTKESQIVFYGFNTINQFILTEYANQASINYVTPESLPEVFGLLLAQEHFHHDEKRYQVIFVGEESSKDERFELASLLKSDPKFASIRVVLISDDMSHEEWEQHQASGFVQQLLLPVDKEQFLASFKASMQSMLDA